MPAISTRTRQTPVYSSGPQEPVSPEHREEATPQHLMTRNPANPPGNPTAPVVTPVISTVLRCPMPNIVSPSPDNLRQFYGGGVVPQYRFTPPNQISYNSGKASVSGTSGSLTAQLTTSANTSDTVSIVGVRNTSYISLTPTNSISAAMTGVYVSAKSTGSIVITHPATAGGKFDIIVTS